MIRPVYNVLFCFAVETVCASPFLTADPQCYDTSGASAECPSGYEYSEDQGATWLPMDAEISAESIVLMHDMQNLAIGGHSWEIRAYNAWGVSESVPWQFSTGGPAPPSGFRISAPPMVQ